MKYFILVLAATFLLAGCDGPASPEYVEIRNMKFKGIKNKNIKLVADAVFSNPNNFGVKITQMECDVFVDGKKSAFVQQELESTMPANSEFSVPLKIDVPVKKAFKGLGMAIGGIFKKKKALVRMTGFIRVKMAGVGMKIPFDYEEEYQVKLFGKGEDLENVELEKVD